jgi:hypothetical protein
MIDFPDSTACNTLLPKKTFYERLSFTAAQKNLFVHEIEKIIWRNKLSASTLNLQPGKRVTELQVFEVVLKKKSICFPVLKLLGKGIPYHLLFLLRFGDQVSACIGYRETPGTTEQEFFHTGWMTFAELPLQVLGLTMDDVYDNFIRQIHQDLEEHENVPIAEAIRAATRKQQIEKQLDRLEKLARAEKQPRRKFNLIQEIRRLEKSKT